VTGVTELRLRVARACKGDDRTYTIMITAFIGKIDDVRLYNAALSAGEVAYVATQSTGGSGAGYVPC